MIDFNQPLDRTNPEDEALLADIQGNILIGHGRDFTAHLFLEFTADPATVRAWIATFSQAWVTSAQDAGVATSGWKATGGRGVPFTMFLLSADGYVALGLEDSIPVPWGEFDKEPFRDQYFKRGMKGQATMREFPRARAYNDPPSTEWDNEYQGVLHAMVLLADDDCSRLECTIHAHVPEISRVARIVAIERGRALYEKFGGTDHVIEHFGYRDGISQPQMIVKEITDEVQQRGNSRWDPSAPLSLALTKEPGDNGSYGSFMVFRKLEQNVASFAVALDQLAALSGISTDNAGALAVGRHRDGRPIAPTAGAQVADDINDFHFDDDPEGAKCPFHAHIRKTNPRGDIVRILAQEEKFERSRRIVRRGITYGQRPDLDNPGAGLPFPEKDVGLLFMCFQASLDQFIIQQEGSDANDFVPRDEPVGPDAVIGQQPAPMPQTWPSTGTVKFTMANFVKMKGGEYFFAPSLPFLRSLAPVPVALTVAAK